MKHFIALCPNAQTRDRLAAMSQRFQAWGLPANWVHTEDFHLTLAFLGELTDMEIDGMRYALEVGASGLSGLTVPMQGLFITGGTTLPKVVAAAVLDPENVLSGLASDMFEIVGLPPEKRFAPHMTLCRPKPGPMPKERSWPQFFEAFGCGDWGPCSFDSIAFYQSRSAPQGGPKYQAVWCAELI